MGRRKAQDPTQAANQQVLDRRQELIDKNMREVPDLGLGLKKADTAAEFLRDAWDKKTFGDEPKTVSRIVYGPDPLIDTCPTFKAALEKNGREAYAEATAGAILRFGHKAVPDPVMQKGLFAAIRQFGAEKVAEAFRDRILKIPERMVEYETDNGEFGDPLLLGSNALRDCVAKFGEPGKAYKFLSARCIDVLGMRGYTMVLDGAGNPVKAGTLFMAWIPQHIADQRRMQFARESEEQVRAQEDEYMDQQERFVRQAGRVGAGSRPLTSSDKVTGYASERADLVGTDIEMGLHFERETGV